MSSKVTQRDYEIFQHVLRYRISSREAIHRVLFPKVTINAVTKVTVRLQAQNWLNRYPSVVPQCYFTLTPQTALLLGVSETRWKRSMRLSTSRRLIARATISINR